MEKKIINNHGAIDIEIRHKGEFVTLMQKRVSVNDIDTILMTQLGAKNLHSALGELLNIPDEISRLKALLISEKRKYLQRFEDDSYEGRMATRQSLQSFIDQHNLK